MAQYVNVADYEWIYSLWKQFKTHTHTHTNKCLAHAFELITEIRIFPTSRVLLEMSGLQILFSSMFKDQTGHRLFWFFLFTKNKY